MDSFFISSITLQNIVMFLAKMIWSENLKIYEMYRNRL